MNIARGPTRCIFCGGLPLTKEHIWPNWLTRSGLIAKQERHGQVAVQQDIDPISHTIVFSFPEVKDNHNGALLQRKQRIVCRECNIGWMSKLVLNAKPLLLDFLTGKESDLDDCKHNVLAAWIALSTITAEFMDRKTIGIAQDDRAYLLKHRTPPSNWRIFTGLYDGVSWAPARYRHHGDKLAISSPDGRTRRGLSQTTPYVIGSVACHAFSSTEPIVVEFFDRHCAPAGMIRLWPPSGAANWPPPYTLSDADMTFIADLYSLETMKRGLMLQGNS